jgi:hypothetical protein
MAAKIKAMADQLKADMIIRAPHPIECYTPRKYRPIQGRQATGITQTKTQSDRNYVTVFK